MGTNGAWHRLPEDDRYYFGTVSDPDKLMDGSADCVENHYFYANASQQWVANGADGLDNAMTSVNGCVGCSKIAALEIAYSSADNTHQIMTPSPVVAVVTLDDQPSIASPLRYGLYLFILLIV